MRRLFLILMVLFVSVWLGTGIAKDPGYVLIAREKWAAELPLWFAIFLLFASFITLYGLLRLWSNIYSLPKYWRNKSLLRDNQRAAYFTNQGLLLLIENKLILAEKKLLKGLTNNSMSWLNYLAAAYAAKMQGNLTKTNEYLTIASKVSSEAKIVAGFMQAQFYCEQQQTDQALAILKQLYLIVPKHTYLLQQLTKMYLQLGNWRELLTLMPELRKLKIFPLDKIRSIEVQIYQGLLQEVAHGELARLQSMWQAMPRDVRENPLLVSCYAKLLIANQAYDTVEKLLNKHLSKMWSDEWGYLYGLIKSTYPDKQLMNAEVWLKSYPNNATLLRSAGRICLHNQLWGKAKSYFEASIRNHPQANTYQELGKLLEQLGEFAAAKECYVKGLELAINEKNAC